MEVLIDVYEGSLDIDEDLLYAEGVRGIIVRLNDINGGLHKDVNFNNQWAQAEHFLRAPYYVYTPWSTGQQNYDWMNANLPTTGVTRLFIDVEVTKPLYDKDVYADQLVIFMNLTKQKWPRAVIYTGAWFLPILAHWPSGEYWWARYPYTLCPPGDRQVWSWQKFRTTANIYGYRPDPDLKCPGIPSLWQCSGDKLILPGCAERAVDLNLWNGNLTSLENWWGAEMPEPPYMGVEYRLRVLWEQALAHGWEL